MATTITVDEQPDLVVQNNQPPVLISVAAVLPPLVLIQTPGVGPVGPQGVIGLTGATGEAGHAQIALSIPGQLSVRTGIIPFVFTRATTVHSVMVAVGIAPIDHDLVFDVLTGGTSLFVNPNDRPRIVQGNYVAVAPSIPDVDTFAAGDTITVDVDEIGTTNPGWHASIVLDTS